MKKNIWIILALLVMLAICSYIWALIFRPAFVQPVTDFFVNLKNGSQEELVNTGVIEIEKKVEEPKDGGLNCGGLIWGCASGGVESTGAVADLSVTSNEKILDTGLQFNEIIDKLSASEKESEWTYDKLSIKIVQGDFSAEYISPKDYLKDADKIVVHIAEEKFELPGVYGKKEIQEYNEFVKSENAKQVVSDKPQEGYIKIDSKYYPIPSSWDAIMSKIFTTFRSFSPSGYYLLYDVWWFEYSGTKMVDVRTGKSVIDFEWGISFWEWTKDKKQFIYGYNSAFWGFAGLYITKSGEFPKTEKLNPNYALAGFLDDSYLYVKTEGTGESWGGEAWKKYLKIYDLKTLKEVYSKEIK